MYLSIPLSSGDTLEVSEAKISAHSTYDAAIADATRFIGFARDMSYPDVSVAIFEVTVDGEPAGPDIVIKDMSR